MPKYGTTEPLKYVPHLGFAEYDSCCCSCSALRWEFSAETRTAVTPSLSRHLTQATVSKASADNIDVITDQSRRNVIARGMKRFESKGKCPPQADIERLSPRVVSILGHNPTTFTLNGTNCYLIGTGSSRLLVDPGETGYGSDKFLQSLRRCLKTRMLQDPNDFDNTYAQ